jgi:hypothetical protein
MPESSNSAVREAPRGRWLLGNCLVIGSFKSRVSACCDWLLIMVLSIAECSLAVNCCGTSPAQLFFVSGPVGSLTKFLFVRSPFVCPEIRPPLGREERFGYYWSLPLYWEMNRTDTHSLNGPFLNSHTDQLTAHGQNCIAQHNSKLTLTFATTFLGFGSRRDSWPNLYPFRNHLCVWEWILLFDDKRGWSFGVGATFVAM